MEPVFIAYAPGDEAASMIVDAYLRATGYPTHKAPDNRDLPSHDPDQTTHYWQALRAARAFVLLWSSRTAESQKVACDWQYALRRKLPLFVLALDETPLPPVLQANSIIAGMPGPDTLSRLAYALDTTAKPVQPTTAIELAFIDFVCWFFDDVIWDYDPHDRVFPVRVTNVPNLSVDTPYRVKFLCEPDEHIWPFYANIARPHPLVVLEFDQQAFENNFFFQANGWVFVGERWEPYTWVQCESCKRWQLADDEDDGDGLYESWCLHCKTD